MNCKEGESNFWKEEKLLATPKYYKPVAILTVTKELYTVLHVITVNVSIPENKPTRYTTFNFFYY